ncbi:transcriptional regulator, TetR family [Sphingomonas laterariae]|uniref:Transcriptional regulator, TetR family n=1 Tax=Edaphosphingomonas laterariae TaxID=861865 RepID=A0A239E2Y6_9SPHN|nr:TetR/AcrR family transcriptional regulator [Sphingomonas laterariae]SNS38648.1 transcriptional regulator, TetR family [Sphingomonas laterariae]
MPILPSLAALPPISLREQQRRATRARITDAALAVFEKRGMGPATIEEILGAAGVSRATFYAHFTGKPDVARAIVADMWASGTELYVRFAELPDWSRGSIRAWLASVGESWRVHHDGMRTLLREMLAEISAESRAHETGFVEALIGDGERWSAFTADEARRRAQLLIFQLERAMMAVHIEEWDTGFDALLDTLTEIWLATLIPARG